MTKRIKRTVISALTVAACIALALVCRIVSRSPLGVPVLLNKVCNVLRSLIYVGLFSAFGFSVYRRVAQDQARNFLIAIAIVTALWIVLRAYKHFYVTDETIVRYLWYAYYIPIILIPTLALLVSLSLGKREGYRLPKAAYALFAPAFALIVSILTNDLHQGAFRFPEDVAVWTEDAYTYGAIFFITAVYDVLCGALSVFLMFKKCKIPRTKKFLWIPIIPFVLVIVYVILYALKMPFARAVGWDLAVFESLSFVFFLESCIRCGFIQTNTLYADLFLAAESISAQIYDNDYNLKYSAKNAKSIDKEVMIRAEEAPFVTEEGVRVNNMAIYGGRAVWLEDMSELLELQNALLYAQDELKERKEFLEYEYKQEEAHKTVEEQNRLYDLLQNETQKQIDEIERLTDRYVEASEEKKREILSKILVLGSYVKRRKDFILLTDKDRELPISKLEDALGESYRALAHKMKGAYAVRSKKDKLDGKVLSEAYDLFEAAIENAYDKARYVNVRFLEVDGALRMVVTLDCETDDVFSAFPTVEIEKEEGETTIVLPLGAVC